MPGGEGRPAWFTCPYMHCHTVLGNAHILYGVYEYNICYSGRPQWMPNPLKCQATNCTLSNLTKSIVSIIFIFWKSPNTLAKGSVRMTKVEHVHYIVRHKPYIGLATVNLLVLCNAPLGQQVCKSTFAYRNSLFFRLVNFHRKNIRVKKFSDRPNWTKFFYKSRVVGINWGINWGDHTACRRDVLWKGDSLLC